MPRRITASSASDSVTGTGALLTCLTGFKPMEVTIYNRTGLGVGYWCAGMLDDEALIFDDTGAGTADASFATSGGITPTFNGFTIGTNAALNTTSDALYWVAYK